MKAGICGICLNSDMLCMACKKKLDEGNVTESYVRMARAVNGLSKTFRQMEGVTINRVVEGKDMAVIVCGKGDRSRMIGREGMIINRLSKAVGKNVRVVEETNDVKEFVQGLISPVTLVGMNVVYTKEGEVLKLIIPRGRSIPMPKTSFDEIIRLVFGKGSVITHA